MFSMTKLAAGAVAGVLSLAVTGAAAFAAFQPVEAVTTAATFSDQAEQSQPERRGGKGELEALNAILERLVQNGTITAEQKETILRAVRAAGQRDERHLKEIWASLMRLSIEHLGLTKEEVSEALRSGTSLGQLAEETSGKGREGLISSLVAQVTAQVDQAVADEKITQEQADRFKTGLVERITRFIDHVYEKKPGRDRDKDRGDRVKVQAFLGDLMKAAVEYFDLERGEIVRQMAQGKSLGQIADETDGKSRGGLVEALTDSASANVDAAVAKGKITEAQGATAKEHLPGAIERFVDATKPGKPKARA